MNRFVPGLSYQLIFHVEKRPTPNGEPHVTQFRRVSPGYFSTMRIRTIAGRTFTGGDRSDSLPVAVVSRLFAEQLFPGEEAVGQTLRRTVADAPPITIVGVVDDVRDVSVTQVPEATLYLPWSQNNNTAVPLTLVVRTGLDPDALLPAVRAAVAAVDPSIPLRDPQPLQRFVDESIGPERFRATVLGLLAMLGLVLAALGIYAVTYRGVVERTHEFAVRLALGGERASVIRLVVGEASRDLALGAAVGLLGGLVLTGVLQRLIANAGAMEAGTTAAALAVLAIATLAAAVIPALRILRVQPADALAQR
jgi:putative ABC transport system permease protein